MKAAIQQTSDLKNYIVICEDGREFVVKDIEAVELAKKMKWELIDERD